MKQHGSNLVQIAVRSLKKRYLTAEIEFAVTLNLKVFNFFYYLPAQQQSESVKVKLLPVVYQFVYCLLLQKTPKYVYFCRKVNKTRAAEREGVNIGRFKMF